MTNITIKTNNHGHHIIKIGGKMVASISARPKTKAVAYVSKRITTDISVLEKVFLAKNCKKVIRADVVKVNPTYANTNGKDPYIAKIDFPATCDLELVEATLIALANKSGNYPELELPDTEEAPAEEETEGEPAET